MQRLLRFGDPLRGPGWNPRSPADPRLNVPRTRALLDLAGRPDASLTCVLIAGTKGKGSTAAFLASILGAAGIRAGLYTSPHLQSWRERIRVDGVALSPRAFEGAVDAATKLVPRLRRREGALGEPSAFELLTVGGLIHFARRRCRVAVLEVGLGGRYDATNAVEPEISVITPIDLDHQAILGPTLARIAREKAGVLRSGRPALLAPQPPPATRSLARACRESAAHCTAVGPVGPHVRLGSAGAHQRTNAALAREAARMLAAKGHAIGSGAIRRGLRRAEWPGRMELVEGAPAVVLDGAHTPLSAAVVARAIGRAYRGRRLHLVIGCTADRDPRALARPFLSRDRRALAYATAAMGPRALAPAEVAGALRRRVAGAYPSVASAIAAARSAAGRSDLICVTGSLALVGEARTALGLPVAERLWEGPRHA